jgi:hypothetical protein
MREEGEQGLLLRAGVQGQVAARLDRQPQRLRALDPLQAHGPQAVLARHHQQRGLAGLFAEPLQHRHAHGAQVGGRLGVAAQRQRRGPQPEALGDLVPDHEAVPLQRRQDAVGGGHGQVAFPADLRGGPLAPLGGEQRQHGEGPLQELRRAGAAPARGRLPLDVVCLGLGVQAVSNRGGRSLAGFGKLLLLRTSLSCMTT